MKTFQIQLPSIPSGQVYGFVTDNDIEYEVRFARKKENILHVIIIGLIINSIIFEFVPYFHLALGPYHYVHSVKFASFCSF